MKNMTGDKEAIFQKMERTCTEASFGNRDQFHVWVRLHHAETACEKLEKWEQPENKGVLSTCLSR